MNFETIAIHDGSIPEPRTGAVSVPIYQTSTFYQDGLGKDRGYEYSRTGNPTREALERSIAQLDLLRPYGIKTNYVDADDLSRFEQAITPATKLIWVETPSNPLLKLIDIAALAEIAHKRGVLLVVDNTFASPYFQQPLNLGADLVVHSTTKYIGGHSDVVGGAVVTSNEEIYEKLKFYQNAAGAVPAPFDSWLFLRGIKTLKLRMEAHEKNALRVAEFLASHPYVERVYYPGLPSHPQHALAKRQMRGFGGMVSFEIAGGLPAVEQFIARSKLFLLAESLGGVESLLCYPPRMTHASISAEERAKRGIHDNLIRLSVGLENGDDLIEDLRTALQR